MKDFREYKAIVVDVDGTLYYQRPVRIAMVCEMLTHFWRVADFYVVYRYRKLYERDYSENERLALLPERSPRIIEEWMLDRPLTHIAHHVDTDLVRLLEEAQRQGVQLIVLSDYPVTEKLAAISLKPDYAYCAEDTGCLKPEAHGIRRILIDLSLKPQDCLVIGDRADKDGALAENLGADSFILPPQKSQRKALYNSLCIL